MSILVASTGVASISCSIGLTNLESLAIDNALARFVCAGHLHVCTACACVATIWGSDGLSWAEFLVVEDAVAGVLRALDGAAGLAHARVAFHVEGLTDREVLTIVDAALVFGLDLAVEALVLLALVRRFPDSAGCPDGA